MNPVHSESNNRSRNTSEGGPEERASGGLVLQPISDMSEYEHKPLEEAQQAAQLPPEELERPHSNLGVMPVRANHQEPVIRQTPALNNYKIVVNCFVLGFFVYAGFFAASLGLDALKTIPTIVMDGGPLLWLALLGVVIVLSLVLKAQRKIYTSMYLMEVRKILRLRLYLRLFIVPLCIGVAVYFYEYTDKPVEWTIIPLVVAALSVITAPFIYYAWRAVVRKDEEEKRSGETYLA